MSLATADAATVDFTTQQRAGTRADDRCQRFGTAANDLIAEQATDGTADDQTSRAIRTAAIIIAILSAIDPVVVAQPPWLVIAAVAVITVGVIVAIARIGAVVVVAAILLPFREGQAFADTIFGNKPTRVDYDMVPSAVFSQPPMAGVGMTESQAKNKLGTVRTYTSDFRPMKNVLAGRNERALYKMVVDASTDVVVGLHMIGPDSAEILQAAAVAVKAGLTKAQFDETVALHPSMAEELVLLK